MKRTLVTPASLLLPALLLLSACGASPAELQATAEAAFARHDYNSAKADVAAALRAQPESCALLLLQARTLLALGDGEGAGATLSRLADATAPTGEMAELAAEAALLRKAPDSAEKFLTGRNSVEASRLRALAAIQRGDIAAAGNHFAGAIAAGGSGRAFADYARFRHIAGDVSGAQEMLAKAQQADPAGIDTLLVAGEIAASRGDFAAALASFDRAVKSYPASMAALIGKAAVLSDLGRIAEMEKVLAVVSASAPDSPDVAYLNARAAAARKDWTAVREIAQRLEGTIGQQEPFRALYGEALLRLEQGELAAAQLAPIARAQPNNRAVIRLLAEARLASGDAAGALAVLRPVADSPQARPDELALMAQIAAKAGDAGAGEYLARSRRPAPQVVGSDVAEADAAMRRGDWGRAVTAYERILAATDGRNIIVLNNMAYAQLMLGNEFKAAEFAARAMKLAPDNASVLDTAGWVKFKSGNDIAEAKRLLRRAAEKAPQNATIRAHLAEAERTPAG
jgi:tetratricopeptide (TPR) repeat protein